MQALTENVPEAELQRAKNAALSTVLSSLESRSVVSEDIGRQTLTYGSRCAPPPPTRTHTHPHLHSHPPTQHNITPHTCLFTSGLHQCQCCPLIRPSHCSSIPHVSL